MDSGRPANAFPDFQPMANGDMVPELWKVSPLVIMEEELGGRSQSYIEDAVPGGSVSA